MLSTRRTRHLVAASVLSVAMVTSLTACSSGFYAATGLQGASGNGANANLGDLQIRDITIVKADGRTIARANASFRVTEPARAA